MSGVILDLARGMAWKAAFRKHSLDPDYYALRSAFLSGSSTRGITSI